jgi:hypothetical protein
MTPDTQCAKDAARALVKNAKRFAGWKEASRLIYQGMFHRITSFKTSPNGRISISMIRDETKLPELIEQAGRGDKDALAVLQREIMDLLRRGSPLPQALQEYVEGALGPGSRRTRRNSAPNLARDWYIAEAVATVERLGFDRTRNVATANKDLHHSACSIVADILKEEGVAMTEQNVARISEAWDHLCRSY